MVYLNKNVTLNQLKELVQKNINHKIEYMPDAFNNAQKKALELFQKRIFLEEVIDESISFNKKISWDNTNKNLNLTTTAEELINVFKLRSDVYTSINYQNEFPDTIEGLNFDKYDKYSAIMYYQTNNEITGSIRLIFDTKKFLPSEKKYSFNYLQEKTDIFYDSLKNDDIIVKLERGIDYSTDRNDFYLESGIHKNAKNTGATLSCISDNTISMNVNQFAEYLSQKKVTGSAGYAYGVQGASAVLGIGLAAAGAAATGGVSLVTGIGGASQAVGAAGGLLNTWATRQDMKQAPNNVKSRGSNILNDIAIEGAFGFTITKVRPLDSELEIIETFLYQNGYKYNKYVNLLDIIDTRTVFNYIETLTLDNIFTIGISNTVLQDILRQLNSGVRFYKTMLELSIKPEINTERGI